MFPHTHTEQNPRDTIDHPSCHKWMKDSQYAEDPVWVCHKWHSWWNGQWWCGVSVIEKNTEDRLVMIFLAHPPACCTTAMNFLPQIAHEDGIYSPETVEEGNILYNMYERWQCWDCCCCSSVHCICLSDAKKYWQWFLQQPQNKLCTWIGEAVTFI